MNDQPFSQSSNDTGELQNTIAKQQQTIEQLSKQLYFNQTAEELRAAYMLTSLTKNFAAPATHHALLELIVQTAAKVIHASAATLFLIDDSAQSLVYEVAIGSKAKEVKNITVPLGHGIAGLVAVSGQPISIANVDDNPQQAADIAEKIGYYPRNILCVPLYYREQVIGVLELLDKQNAPYFQEEDMEVLGSFANQAAIAIEQSRSHNLLISLLQEIMQQQPAKDPAAMQLLFKRARDFAEYINDQDLLFRQSLELAALVQEISMAGDTERTFCLHILQQISSYIHTHQDVHLWERLQ